MSIVAVNSGNVVTLIVRIVSQPVVEEIVSVTEPTPLNTCPKMVVGKLLAQTAVSIVVVNSGSVVTLITLIVSQPVEEETVSVTEPIPLKTCPKMVTGKVLAQTAVSIVVVNIGSVVALIVLIVSQPEADETVSVTDPTWLNT